MNERLQALNNKKTKLLARKENIEKQIKETDSKIKELETASTLKELDQTVIVLKDRGLDVKDVLKAIRAGNVDDIKRMFQEPNE